MIILHEIFCIIIFFLFVLYVVYSLLLAAAGTYVA